MRLGAACGVQGPAARLIAASKGSDLNHICQKSLPNAPWLSPATRRLPGVQPLDMVDWLVVDDAFAGQMALRDRLLADRRPEVLAALPGSRAAAAELLETVLAHLPGGYHLAGGAAMRPDGVRVALEGDPLMAAARLVQEDLCILERPGETGEHRLTAAALCFPASWRLDEKIGRPLAAIHAPVQPYDGQMAARVQRLFDRVRPGAPLWRQNALLYHDPSLFQPRAEAAPRAPAGAGARYLRSERQCIVKLPRTGAVVFSIHTWVVALDDLGPEQRAGLAAHPIGRHEMDA